MFKKLKKVRDDAFPLFDAAATVLVAIVLIPAIAYVWTGYMYWWERKFIEQKLYWKGPEKNPKVEKE